MRAPKTSGGNVVLITGSSSGIGEITAYRFAREGDTVIVTYHSNKEEGSRVADKCKELGAGAVFLIHLDVTDNASIVRATQQIIGRFGCIDILVNNAGTLIHSPFLKQTRSEIYNQIHVNLEGVMMVTYSMLPNIKKSIINIGSTLGLEGKKRLSVYCATKFGVRGFTQSIAQEYKNLKIFTVNPSLTATRMGGHKGAKAEDVAEVVYGSAVGVISARPGSDLNVRDFRFGNRLYKVIGFARAIKKLLK